MATLYGNKRYYVQLKFTWMIVASNDRSCSSKSQEAYQFITGRHIRWVSDDLSIDMLPPPIMFPPIFLKSVCSFGICLSCCDRCFSIITPGHAVWAEFVTLVHETELFVLAQRCRMMEKQCHDFKPPWEVTGGNDWADLSEQSSSGTRQMWWCCGFVDVVFYS